MGTLGNNKKNRKERRDKSPLQSPAVTASPQGGTLGNGRATAPQGGTLGNGRARRGRAKKVRVLLGVIITSLILAVSGVIAAVCATRDSGIKLDGEIAAPSAMGIGTTPSKPNVLTNISGMKYSYAAADNSLKSGNDKKQITLASGETAYYISTPGEWLWILSAMNGGQGVTDAQATAYRAATYVFAGGTCDFKNATVNAACWDSTKPFTGKIYGCETTFENITFVGIVNKKDETLNTNYEYCGMFAFAEGAEFYDLALNRSCKYKVTDYVANSYVGGYVGYSMGKMTFINCASFLDMEIKHTNAKQTGTNATTGAPTYAANNISMGGFVGRMANKSDAYFNGCAFSGKLIYDGFVGADSSSYFGGLFGLLGDKGGAAATSSTTLKIYNCASSVEFDLNRVGAQGGTIGQVGVGTTCNAKNIVCKYQMTDRGAISPDFGVLIGTFGGTVVSGKSGVHASTFDNIYLYGNDLGRSSSAYDSWMKCNDGLTPPNTSVHNVTTNMTLRPIDGSQAANEAYINNPDNGVQNTVTRKPSTDDVINAAIADTSIKNGGLTVNTDGSVGSPNLPAGNFSITYNDSLAAIPTNAVKEYNSKESTRLPVQSVSGATWRKWAESPTVETGLDHFEGGGRIGNLTLYSLWTLNKPTETATGATKTYGDDANLTIKLEHPQVKAGKAEFVIDGWYDGGTKIITGAQGTGTGANANVSATVTTDATTKANTYKLAFSTPTVAQGKTYTLKYSVNPKSGVTGVKSVSSSKTVTLTMNVKQIAAPTTTEAGSNFVYDNSAKALVWTPGATGIPSRPGTLGAVYTVTGTTTATNAGKYTATFDLNDKKNYIWQVTDPTVNAQTIDWEIAPAKFEDANVEFVLGENGRVGKALGDINGAVSIGGTAKFLYAGGTDPVEVAGEFTWKDATEKISYKDWTDDVGEDGVGIYKTTGVFTAKTDGVVNKNFAVYEAEVTLKVTGNFFDIAEVPVIEDTGAATTAGSAHRVWFDLDTPVKVTTEVAGSDRKVVVNYSNGGEENTVKFDGQVPAGYVADVYYMSGISQAKGGITVDGTDANLHTIDFAGNQNLYSQEFYITYKPTTVKYNVYYLLENGAIGDGAKVVDGRKYYFDTTSTATEMNAVVANNDFVFAAIGVEGRTTDVVKYYDAATSHYLTDITNLEKYEYHTAANTHLATQTIKGDGSTVVVVFLRAKTFTMTMVALGADSHGTQTVTAVYNHTPDFSGIVEPEKKGATFDGWWDAQTGGAQIDLDSYVLTGDTTVYAHFATNDHYIVFDMNSFNSASDPGADPENGIHLGRVLAGKTGAQIEWAAISTLFGAFDSDHFFKATSAEAGKWNKDDYVLIYNVDNMTSNINISSNSSKPTAIGYLFGSWYYTDENNDEVPYGTLWAPNNLDEAPEDCIKLTAHWTKQAYRLVFDRQDGTNAITKNGVKNLSNWETDILTSANLKTPTRTGYDFAGWYPTPACDEDQTGHNIRVETMLSGKLFSIHQYGPLYGSQAEGYNFSSIRLYAKWTSVSITIQPDESVNGGYIDSETIEVTLANGNPSDDPSIVHIGDSVTLEVKALPGYRFVSIKAGKRNRVVYASSTDGDRSTVEFTVGNNDVDMTNKVLNISANFEEITFTISYNSDGGQGETGEATPRTYKASDITSGAIRLPSKFKKLGYDFGGWIFEKAVDGNNDELTDIDGNTINGQYAFDTTGWETDDFDKSLYGETLKLMTVGIDVQDTTTIMWYANLNLKAKWIAQKTPFKLFGATYPADADYGNVDETDKCYIVDSLGAIDLRVGDTVTITSPVSHSFYFVGWATKRGGDVQYPAELRQTGTNSLTGKPVYEAQPVQYTIKPGVSLTGADTHANDLYAVWRIKEMGYVNMAAPSNNSVYNNNGITISAKTAQQYQEQDSDGNLITLDYYWFKVKPDEVGETTTIDHYSYCFNVSQIIYMDEYGGEVGTVDIDSNGNRTAHYANGDPCDESDIKTDYFIENKTFNKDAIGTHCDQITSANKTNVSPTAAVEYVVQNVKDAGRYICIAQVKVGGVVASEEVAFGEINVTMQKAQFTGVVLEGAIKSYNGNAQGLSAALATAANATMSGNVIELTDGTKIIVTYEYRLLDGTENGTLQVDGSNNPLQLVTLAGRYSVKAIFTIDPDSDKGNYTVIDSLTAELEITKRMITNVEFVVDHVPANGGTFTDDGSFNFVYDGNAYTVSAVIKDTDSSNNLLTATEFLGLEVKIYSTGEDGLGKDELLDGDNNPLQAVNAGNYMAEITKLTGGTIGNDTGDDSANYQLGENVQKEVDFVINKATRNLGITFTDDTVEFDNKIHTISISSNDPLPAELTVKYSVAATLEDSRLAAYVDGKILPNNIYQLSDDVGDLTNTEVFNGGRYAGSYLVTAKFSDTEKANYEAIEDMTATLTISKADLFKFYGKDAAATQTDDEMAANGLKTLVTDNGFEGESNIAYSTTANRIRFIKDGLLVSKDAGGKNYFDITYNIYKLKKDGTDTVRDAMLASGSRDNLTNSNVIVREPGLYEIEAVIGYTSPLYSNNFNVITDNPSIVLEIMDGQIGKIVVNYKEDRQETWYVGDEFNMDNVLSLDVYYMGSDTPVNVGGDNRADLAKVKVIYGGEHTSFWKVGEKVQLAFEIYGTSTPVFADGNSDELNDLAKANMFTVKQKIETAELRYSDAEDGTYVVIPEHGLDAANANDYYYRVYFECVDEKGDTVVSYVAVTAKNLVRGVNDNTTVKTETVDVEGVPTQRDYYKLTIGDGGLYELDEVKLSLMVYITVAADDVTWKYYNGTEWVPIDTETWTLPYKGAEYLVRAYFTGEDGQEVYAEGYVNSGMIFNFAENGYNVFADEYTDGYATEICRYYRVDGASIARLMIEKITLSFVWDNDAEDFEGLEYAPGTAQKIELVSDGVTDEDKDYIGYIYNYEKLTMSGGEIVGSEPTSADQIINAGTYRVTITRVTLAQGGSDNEYRLANYRLPAACSKVFEIEKATVRFDEVYYQESGGADATAYNYGRNTTYEFNPQGLRTDKLGIVWGDYPEIRGDLKFVYYDTESGEYKPYASDSDMSTLLKVPTTGDTVKVNFMFSPSEKANYEILFGTIDIKVLSQGNGTEKLRVVRKAGAADYYIVDQNVGTDRFEVYREHRSYYIEDGVEYGKKTKLQSNEYKVLANGQELSGTYRYKVTSRDTKIVITVEMLSVSASGTLEFKVFTSQPVSLTLNNKDAIRKEWYLGETFTFPEEGLGAVTFTIRFADGNEATASFADMSIAVDGTPVAGGTPYKFTVADADKQTVKVTFSYAGLTTDDDSSLVLTIKDKETLQIATPATKVEKFTGEVIAVPVLEYTVDNVTTSEVTGISYDYAIYKDGDPVPVDEIREEGEYTIVYTFREVIGNARFEKPQPFTLKLSVKTVAYQVTFREFTPDELTKVFKNVKYEAVEAEVTEVLDLMNGNKPVTGAVPKVSGIVDEKGNAVSEIRGVGKYTITTTVTYNNEVIATKEYIFEVTQAKNNATISIPNILLGSEIVPTLTFDFGDAANAKVVYSDNDTSGWHEEAPATVGVWYARVTLEGTKDYERAVATCRFVISSKSLADGKDGADNMVEIEGGTAGIAPGTVLSANKMSKTKLEENSIKKYTVLDGYTVSLKDVSGADVQLEDAVTVRLLLNKDLRDKDGKLCVFAINRETGKLEEIKNVERDGNYLVYTATAVNDVVIAEKIPTAPTGLVVGVSLCAAVAAGLIVACVLVFLKKRKV